MSIRLKLISANLMEDGDFFGKGVSLLLCRIPMSRFTSEGNPSSLRCAIMEEGILSGMINSSYSQEAILT